MTTLTCHLQSSRGISGTKSLKPSISVSCVIAEEKHDDVGYDCHINTLHLLLLLLVTEPLQWQRMKTEQLSALSELVMEQSAVFASVAQTSQSYL